MPADRRIMQKYDEIRIEELQIFAHHGVYDFETENGQTIKKRYVKGARLHYYPPYFNPFRCTRNCVKPTVSNVSYKMAKEKASAGTLTFTKTVQLKDTEKDFENTIQTEYYNTKRK